jgi:hypothetical protein
MKLTVNSPYSNTATRGHRPRVRLPCLALQVWAATLAAQPLQERRPPAVNVPHTTRTCHVQRSRVCSGNNPENFNRWDLQFDILTRPVTAVLTQLAVQVQGRPLDSPGQPPRKYCRCVSDRQDRA